MARATRGSAAASAAVAVASRRFDTPPGVMERQKRILRQYQEYGANWNFGVKGTF